MSRLKLGSLFDGSGGFPLGGILAGITPVWASEIEPFPIRVTTRRLPQMKHLGDVSKINGAEIEPVDIITFGSPCTDMSIAGKRAGLDGRQSSLFYQAIRIIKEMRCATNGKYPRWICWENVLGAYSSNKGADFKAVLDAIINIVEPGAEVPMPEKSRWPYADCYMGDGWSVAYRTLDAQYWGVPQRRRRCYLVGDLAGQCAGRVLFESEGLSGYSAEIFRMWQRATMHPSAGVGETGRICLNDQGGSRMNISENVTCTLRAESHHPPCVIASESCAETTAKSRAGEVSATLYENHSQDARYTGPLDTAPTVAATYGMGGNNQPFVVEMKTYDVRFTSEGTRNERHNVYETNTSRTIDTGGNAPDSNQGGVAVVAYGIQGSMIGRKDKNGPQGCGVNKEVSFTLNTTDRHSVYAISMCGFPQICKEHSPTLMARDYKDPTSVGREQIVRRLTPTECARLQGFPDWWCAELGTSQPTESEIDFWSEVWETRRNIMGTASRPKSRNQIIKWLKDPHSDSAEYKMWGNGVALPCVYFVLAGIAWAEDRFSD